MFPISHFKNIYKNNINHQLYPIQYHPINPFEYNNDIIPIIPLHKYNDINDLPIHGEFPIIQELSYHNK